MARFIDELVLKFSLQCKNNLLFTLSYPLICLTSATLARHLKVIYKKIATELKARINSDDYAVGDMLPSEKALAAELQVSVMTLRKALALLEEEKLIARRHGSGTCIVRKSNYHGGELEGFNYQMQVVGVTNYRNKVIEFTLLDAPPAIAQQLKIQPGEKVYYVRRLRLIDEVPILVENSYIPFATFPWLSVGNLEQSKFNYFKKECHITIIESHRSYTPVLATREQAELLQVAPNSLLLRVQSVSYAQTGRSSISQRSTRTPVSTT